ncbi:MAG: peptide ABC transporter substrate-binding protein [Acetobacter sp.]|nr:peptide ABC transporter substrate-binding protein [Bacteroides sp.]MCM1341485.1 peptide ABC transporter substrate-binding protein [Acetobacter sp.]MCM1434178.1 peptide ABC transporter substrate-binding protein [Clostridiales bacterium]
MKRIIKIISIILCVSLLSTLFSSCSKEEKAIDFIYPFNCDIVSFDPQIASTADEFLVIENCFEGLVRVNDDGKVQAGVAESWSISDDGLVYTFQLRKGAKWRVLGKDEETLTKAQELMGKDFNPDITADDFVFALQRAVMPITDCPLFSSVSSIVNAVKIHSGKLNANKLGIKAIDNYTLEIRLSNPDDSFMTTLSTAVAMPCNRDYFEATKGRYGLGLDYTIFNGQFYVSSILEASYILKNNEQYIGEYPSKVSDITLKFITEESDIPKNLKSGYYDSAYISGSDYEKLGSSGITAVPYSNKTWAFLLNKNRQILSNKALRQAVCLSISDIDLSSHEYLTKATNLIPPSCSIYGTSADKALGTTVQVPNSEKASEMWKKGLSETGYTSASFTVIATEDMEDIVKLYAQGIQSSIGQVTGYDYNQRKNSITFSLEIKLLNQKEFSSAISNGEYDLALYQFESSSHSAVNFLSNTINGNIAGEIPSAEAALKKAQSANSGNAVKRIKACEKALLEDYSIYPVMFESSYYAQAEGVSGVDFHPGSGRVCFVNATREE